MEAKTMTPQEFQRLRQEIGLSASALSERWGYSAQHVGKIERGETPLRQVYVDALERVAQLEE